MCIFAYGQTGSGKTYTMEGPSMEEEESRGMIARAVLQIFNNTQELEAKGWQVWHCYVHSVQIPYLSGHKTGFLSL